MARAPFKLKSGNRVPFKQMGSSPVKQNIFKDPDRMAKKYGTGDFAASGSRAKERVRPGESKYKYDVRRKREDKKAKRLAATIKEVKKDTFVTPLPEGANPKNLITVKKGSEKANYSYDFNVQPKAKETDYSSMSVNDLVKLRSEGNKDVQKVINAKLKANPNKWD